MSKGARSTVMAMLTEKRASKDPNVASKKSKGARSTVMARMTEKRVSKDGSAASQKSKRTGSCGSGAGKGAKNARKDVSVASQQSVDARGQSSKTGEIRERVRVRTDRSAEIQKRKKRTARDAEMARQKEVLPV